MSDEFSEFNAFVVQNFAADNNFNKVCISTNPNIRTNRTRGNFEKAIHLAIADYKQTDKQTDCRYTFDTPQDFSFYPSNYQLKDMDVIWSQDS